MDHKSTDAFEQNHAYALQVVERNRNHAQGMADAMKSLDRSRILRVLEAVTMQRVEWQAAIHALRLLPNDETYFADVQSSDGWSPLAFAAARGEASLLEQLVERGATLDLETAPGLTPLAWAAICGKSSVAKILIVRGATVDLASRAERKTALHQAAHYGQYEIVELLLNGMHAATIGQNRQDHHAWLTDCARQVDQQDVSGMSALQYARAGGHIAVEKLLKQYRRSRKKYWQRSQQLAAIAANESAAAASTAVAAAARARAYATASWVAAGAEQTAHGTKVPPETGKSSLGQHLNDSSRQYLVSKSAPPTSVTLNAAFSSTKHVHSQQRWLRELQNHSEEARYYAQLRNIKQKRDRQHLDANLKSMALIMERELHSNTDDAIIADDLHESEARIAHKLNDGIGDRGLDTAPHSKAISAITNADNTVHRRIAGMSSDDVIQWLSAVGLEECCGPLQNACVDGDALLQLGALLDGASFDIFSAYVSTPPPTGLGIATAGHVLKLTRQLRQLLRAGPPRLMRISSGPMDDTVPANTRRQFVRRALQDENAVVKPKPCRTAYLSSLMEVCGWPRLVQSHLRRVLTCCDAVFAHRDMMRLQRRRDAQKAQEAQEAQRVQIQSHLRRLLTNHHACMCTEAARVQRKRQAERMKTHEARQKTMLVYIQSQLRRALRYQRQNVYTVKLQEGKLGLHIAGNNHRVLDVTADGAGDALGVELGTDLVQVGQIDVRGMVHHKCVELLGTKTRPLELTFVRKQAAITPTWLSYEVRIQDRGMIGIQLAGSKHRVTKIIKGGAADRAGVEKGTHLVCVGQTDVRNMTHEVCVELLGTSPRPLRLAFARKPLTAGSEQYDVTIESPGVVGLFLSGRTHIVTGLVPDSAAENAGVRPGSELVFVNGRDVRGISHEECKELISKSSRPLQLLLVCAVQIASPDAKKAAAQLPREQQPPQGAYPRDIEISRQTFEDAKVTELTVENDGLRMRLARLERLVRLERLEEENGLECVQQQRGQKFTQAHEYVEGGAEKQANWKAGEQANIEAGEHANIEAGEHANTEAGEHANTNAGEHANTEAGEHANTNAGEQAKCAAKGQAKCGADMQAKYESESREHAKRNAEKHAKHKVEIQGKCEPFQQQKYEPEEQAEHEMEGHPHDAGEQAQQEAKEWAKHDVEAQAQRGGQEQAKHESEEQANRDAEEQGQRKAQEHTEGRAMEEANGDAEKTKRELKEEAVREAGKKVQHEIEQRAQPEAEEQAKREAEEHAKRDAEERVQREAKEHAKREAEESAKCEVEEKAERMAEEHAKLVIEHIARKTSKHSTHDVEGAAMQELKTMIRQNESRLMEEQHEIVHTLHLLRTQLGEVQAQARKQSEALAEAQFRSPTFTMQAQPQTPMLGVTPTPMPRKLTEFHADAQQMQDIYAPEPLPMQQELIDWHNSQQHDHDSELSDETTSDDGERATSSEEDANSTLHEEEPPPPPTEADLKHMQAREQVMDYFKKYDPDRLDTLDSLMHQYMGREDELLEMLKKAVAAKQYTSSAAAANKAVHDRESVRAEIVAYCEQHSPEKLAQVDDMMQQFAGRESDLLGFMRAAQRKKQQAIEEHGNTANLDARAESSTCELNVNDKTAEDGSRGTVVLDNNKSIDEGTGQISECEAHKEHENGTDSNNQPKPCVRSANDQHKNLAENEHISEHEAKQDGGHEADTEHDKEDEQKSQDKAGAAKDSKEKGGWGVLRKFRRSKQNLTADALPSAKDQTNVPVPRRKQSAEIVVSRPKPNTEHDPSIVLGHLKHNLPVFNPHRDEKHVQSAPEELLSYPCGLNTTELLSCDGIQGVLYRKVDAFLSKWKKRFFVMVLSKRELRYYKRKPSNPKELRSLLSGVIMLDSARIVPFTSKPKFDNYFQVQAPSHHGLPSMAALTTFELRAPSPYALAMWMGAVQFAIKAAQLWTLDAQEKQNKNQKKMMNLLTQVTALQEKQHAGAAVVCNELGSNATHLRKANNRQEQKALKQLAKTAAQRHKSWLMNAPESRVKTQAALALAARVALWAATYADAAAEEALDAVRRKQEEQKAQLRAEAAAKAALTPRTPSVFRKLSRKPTATPETQGNQEGISAQGDSRKPSVSPARAVTSPATKSRKLSKGLRGSLSPSTVGRRKISRAGAKQIDLQMRMHNVREVQSLYKDIGLKPKHKKHSDSDSSVSSTDVDSETRHRRRRRRRRKENDGSNKMLLHPEAQEQMIQKFAAVAANAARQQITGLLQQQQAALHAQHQAVASVLHNVEMRKSELKEESERAAQQRATEVAARAAALAAQVGVAAAESAARKVGAACVQVQQAAHRRADSLSVIAMADLSGENFLFGDDYGMSLHWMGATQQPGLEHGKDSTSDESDNEAIARASNYLYFDALVTNETDV